MDATDDGSVDAVLWDFGDTLADERWCWVSPPGVPQWTDAWSAFAESDLVAAWGRGEAGFDDVVDHVATACGMPLDAVRAHIAWCCANITFHDRTWRIARARLKPQAIVTVNPVEFRSLIAAVHDLDRVFDVIVVSGEERTDDKADLCDRALEQLGIGSRTHALLVDNLLPNVEGWRRRGGRAHWYRGDGRFADTFEQRGWGALSRHSGRSQGSGVTMSQQHHHPEDGP